MLRKRNACCFGNDVLHFDERWLMQKTNLPDTPAIEALLRGLKSTDIDFSILEMGYHLEKLAFLQVANILALALRSVRIHTQWVMLKT